MKKIRFLLLAILAFGAPSFVLAGNPVAYLNAATTAAPVLVATGTRQLQQYNLSNPNATLVYVQIFDASSAASVTLGTTPPTLWFGIPANNGVTDGSFIPPYVFVNGIVVAVTTTPTGNTAPASNVPVVLTYE